MVGDILKNVYASHHITDHPLLKNPRYWIIIGGFGEEIPHLNQFYPLNVLPFWNFFHRKVLDRVWGTSLSLLSPGRSSRWTWTWHGLWTLVVEWKWSMPPNHREMQQGIPWSCRRKRRCKRRRRGLVDSRKTMFENLWWNKIMLCTFVRLPLGINPLVHSQ